MKQLWFILLILILAAATFTVVVSCGDDDDDDDDDDTNDDDDDDASDDDDDTGDDDDDTGDDDDDVTGDVTITDVTIGACGDASPDPTVVPLDIVETSWEGDVLTVFRKNALINCEPVLTVEGTLDGGTLTIAETDAGVVDCECNTDVQYKVNGLPGSDNIEVKVTYTATKGWNDIALFNINTNDAAHELQLGFVEVMMHDVTYPADTDIDMNVGVCYLEDPDTVQFHARLMGDSIMVYSMHRRTLPLNPDDVTAACSIIPWTMPGIAAGTYSFYAPMRDENGDYEVFEDLNSPVTFN